MLLLSGGAAEGAPELSWQMRLGQASALLHDQNVPPSVRRLKVVDDCHASLKLQKSPDGYLFLTKAYLSGGPGFAREAEAASLKYLDSVAGSAEGLHMTALSALLASDQATARAAIVRFVDNEVKNGHVDGGTVSGAKTSAAEMRAYLPASLSTADRQLISAFIDFCHGSYAAAFVLQKNAPAAAAGESGLTSRTLALCANILQKRLGPGQTLLDQLLKTPGSSVDSLTLLDDLYFISDRRDEGLKRLDALESAPAVNKAALKLMRSRVLDQMGQPEQALKALDNADVLHVGKAPLGMRCTLLDNDPILDLARLEAKLNRTDMAIKHLQICMGNNPDAGQPYFLRAQIYAQKAQWLPARADLSRAINGGFSLVKACRARAGCASALGDRSGAKADMALAAAFLGQNQSGD